MYLIACTVYSQNKLLSNNIAYPRLAVARGTVDVWQTRGFPCYGLMRGPATPEKDEHEIAMCYAALLRWMGLRSDWGRDWLGLLLFGDTLLLVLTRLAYESRHS